MKGGTLTWETTTGLTERISAVDPDIRTRITELCISQQPSTVPDSVAVAWQTFQIIARAAAGTCRYPGNLLLG